MVATSTLADRMPASETKSMNFWNSATLAGVRSLAITNFTIGTVAATSGEMAMFLASDLRASSMLASTAAIDFAQAAANFLAASGFDLMKSPDMAVPAAQPLALSSPST